MAGRELACKGNTGTLFFGPLDGRKEKRQERNARELIATTLCQSCDRRISCLEDALVWKNRHGVWGGMGEQERRDFEAHLKKEGYGNDIPSGDELKASLASFYRKRTGKKVRVKDVTETSG